MRLRLRLDGASDDILLIDGDPGGGWLLLEPHVVDEGVAARLPGRINAARMPASADVARLPGRINAARMPQ